MIMALVLELIARTGKPLSRLFAELPQYAQAKDRVMCPNELKERTLEALNKRVKAHRIETIDGLKLCYDDGAWILFRPSGTEPVFRLYAEAATQERSQELVDENKRLIEETVSSLR
jgi:phosphomannomutase/phosphoglucomutase